jgi:hypothetical protein
MLPLLVRRIITLLMVFSIQKIMLEKKQLRAFAENITSIPARYSKWNNEGLSPTAISRAIREYGE